MKILFWMFVGFDRHATSEHLLAAVIEQLCRAGHAVHILEKHTGGSLPSIPEKLAGFSVTADAVPFAAADKGNFVARYLAELKYIRACEKRIASGFDAVFIQSTTAAGFAVRAVRKKLPKAAVTFNVQDIFPYNLMYGGHRLKKSSPVFQALAAAQRYGYARADRIITISEDMKDTLAADGVDPGKIDVIYNWSYQDEPYEGVDTAPVSRLFKNDRFNVVYAGNIGLMQNVDLLVEAARLMKDDRTVWFQIIGNGLAREKLEERARAYGIENISFWPMQPPEAAPLIYSAAGVNVIPLVKDGYRTALPSKTATCLACGKPIILAIGRDSRFGRKAMEEAGCLLVEPDRPQELAEAIRSVQAGGPANKADGFFRAQFSLTENSGKYAKIIAGDSQ